MISEHLFLDAPQRGPDRGDLRDDINAVAILFDHFGQAADLTFDYHSTTGVANTSWIQFERV